MMLRDRRGRESRRQISGQVLEVPDDGDKSLFVFDDPRDVQGTAFSSTRIATARTSSGYICPP